MVSESAVSNTKVSEFFDHHRAPRRELSEFLSAYYLCAEANSPSFFAEVTKFAAELSEFCLPKQKGIFERVDLFSAPLRFALTTLENLKGSEKKQTLQKTLFGQPFLRATPSPLLP